MNSRGTRITVAVFEELVQRCGDADSSASFLTICGRMQTQPYIQFRTWTRLSEFVNCMYATNANKSCHFRIISDSFNLARNISNVFAVIYFLYW